MGILQNTPRVLPLWGYPLCFLGARGEDLRKNSQRFFYREKATALHCCGILNYAI
jgi:hypothetical protein